MLRGVGEGLPEELADFCQGEPRLVVEPGAAVLLEAEDVERVTLPHEHFFVCRRHGVPAVDPGHCCSLSQSSCAFAHALAKLTTSAGVCSADVAMTQAAPGR